MFQIQSPTYSNSNKINLSSLISPCRNKRIASVENCFTTLHSHRNNNNNNSCKKIDSPSKVAADQTNKMRKRSQNSHYKNKSKEMIAQINGLKEEYLGLKSAYKELVNQKIKKAEKQTVLQEQNQRVKKQNQKIARQNQNLKGKVSFLQQEVERIKRQSIKLIQIWQFRTNKIQSTLTQRQKHIEILKQCLKQHNIMEPRSSTKQSISPKHKKSQVYDLALLSQSLIMGKYNNQNVSRMSQYFSVSLNQIREEEMEEKICQHSERALHASQEVGAIMCDITNKNKEQQHKKSQNNFKKFRKQLCKKIQVNMDDKHKQFISQIQPKTPHERKPNTTKSSNGNANNSNNSNNNSNNNNNNNKSIKSKIKKEDEFACLQKENKSSKKKASIK